MMQVLINLLKNSINFTAQGSITLKVLYDESRSSLVVHVCDTGSGIELEDLSTIFNDASKHTV